MAEVIYALCGITSGICGFLLMRGYLRTKVRILLWSAICFIGIALNNALVFVDLVLIPTAIDLSLPRAIVLAAAVSVQVFGFIWESK